MAFAIAVFAGALALIASERIDRTKVALLGATLVLLAGTIDQHGAIAAVDFNTIGLLAGMMLMVRLTEATGVYTWVAIRAGQLSRGRPPAVVIALSATTAVLSAFLDNVTTILLIVPITFLLADALDVDALPLVIIEIIASNIGGTATLIGDPPNILIAGHTGLSFGAFIVNLAPIALVAAVVVVAMLYVAFRSRLHVAPDARVRLMQLDAARSIEDRPEAWRTVPVLLATIVAFFLHGSLGIEPATIALAGASVMLLTSRQSLRGALAGIEWPTLFFLMALFVMVGALEQTGALRAVADGLSSVTGDGRAPQLLGILGLSAIGSGLVDNIPFTAAMLPVVDALAGPASDAHWWALALGACFGGNATIVAAAANVAASGLASRAGSPIRFITYLGYGLAATAVSVLLAAGYVMIRYV